jgi:hypothetical protein
MPRRVERGAAGHRSISGGVLVVVMASIGLAALTSGHSDRGFVSVTTDAGRVVGTSRLAIGVTHAQRSADAWGDPAAVARARRLLRETATLQNQHVMGFGAGNPEPSPGRFDWSSLDARVALMQATGATPVITLCCAPDWMKGGRPGQTDWQRLAVAPAPVHFEDYARLAAAVAQRYPDVKRFQVWNEMKGFWDRSARRWDAAAYTRLYNAIYDAVKAVRPDAQLGGPYVVLDSWRAGEHKTRATEASGAWGGFDQRPLDVVRYWLAHAHGADFIALDGANGRNKDGWPAGPFAGCDAFAAAARWLRALGRSGYPLARTLPLVWSEWTAAPSAEHAGLNQSNAIMASCMITTLRSGAAAVLIWSPEGDRSGHGFPEALWTSSAHAGGGRPTPWAATQRAFRTAFPPGMTLLATRVVGGPVDALASPRHLLLVNRSRVARRVRADGHELRLGPWGVRLLARGSPGS